MERDRALKPFLKALFLYPVKSLAGVEPTSWPLDRFGLRWDRRWMVVDPSGRFLTQRKLPKMATIGTAIDLEGRLRLFHPEMGEREVPVEPEGGEMEVKVWRDRVVAVRVGEEVDRWLEAILGTRCHLVFFPEGARRPVDPKFAPKEAVTAFSDGFPLLVLGEASLEALNSHLREPVSVRRFRPNLLIAGAEPYAEDRWRKIAISGIPIALVKPCPRCVVTTIDPDLGVPTGQEPLLTLGRLRRGLFGQNGIHLAEGWLEVGAPVEVLS